MVGVIMKKIIICLILIINFTIFLNGNDFLAITRNSKKDIVLYSDGTWEYLKKVLNITDEWKLIDKGSIKISELEIKQEDLLLYISYNNSTNEIYNNLAVKVALLDKNNKIITEKEKLFRGNISPGSTKFIRLILKCNKKAPADLKLQLYQKEK